MTLKTIFLALAASALALPAAATAQERPLQLDTQIALVRAVDSGEQLLPATSVVPGDLLQFTINYRNNTSETVTDFVVVAPVSGNVELSGDVTSNLTVSVDGGSVFGALANLQVTQTDGSLRAAVPADITHLRWVIASIAPATGGTLHYRAAVK